jgi:hypothetical protein
MSHKNRKAATAQTNAAHAQPQPRTAPNGATTGTAPVVAGAEASTTQLPSIAAIDNCGRHVEIQCVQFTSPNSDEMMTIDEAPGRLTSNRHLIAKQSADVLDEELGLRSQLA